MLFKNLPLNATIQEALKRKGYAEATPIQFQTIEAFESGQHILGQSQTGSGKTAAFVLPLLNVVDTKLRKPQILVICPTRELATQTEDEFYKLSFGMMGLKTCMANGGTSIRRQIEKINQGAQVIVGTPGRIQDLLEKRVLRTESIQYLVLDEADRMLDMGFVEEVEAIWDQLKNLKQVMSFSATVTDELNRILTRHLGDDIVRITTSTQIVVDTVEQSFSLTPHVHKFSQLMKYLTHHRGDKILIFAQTKQMTGDLAADLNAE
jgi:ATP-dependent RNA helicase DeaD